MTQRDGSWLATWLASLKKTEGRSRVYLPQQEADEDCRRPAGKPITDANLGVLLTPRALGGHEVALLGWLADARRQVGLRPAIVAPGADLAQALASAGLADCRWPPHPAQAEAAAGSRAQVLAALWQWPADKPLLLAPGALHTAAWLLAAALVLGKRVWVYVPNTHTARQMQWSLGPWRDAGLAPWLRRVEGWITVHPRHAQGLAQAWRVPAPVHVLPNLPRLAGAAPCWPAPSADGRLRVVFVGRFDLWTKGLDWLIDNLLKDPAWTRSCHWRFQGQGPGAAALHAAAQALGQQNLTIDGHAPIDQALACSDVLLLCSRFEGVPLVALEATARGWPVVASRESGVADLLPAASLFDFGDSAGMRQALFGLLAPGARQAAVAHARAQVACHNSPQDYERALATVCRSMLAAPGGVLAC